MALYSDANALKQYLFEHSEAYTNPMFILAHAPYCAKHMTDKENGTIYREILQRMFQSHPYATPFYYIGYVTNSAQWCSAETCKKWLRDICDDLSRLVPWFKSQGLPDGNDQVFMDNLQPLMTDYLKSFIRCVRAQQRDTGANESVMANYAPIIPYGVSLSKDSMYDMSSEYLDQSFMKEYPCIFDNKEMPGTGLKRDAELAMIALKNTKDIIENIDEMFSWYCPMDVFSAVRNSRYNNDTFRYLGYVWLMSQDTLITPEDLDKQFTDFCTFKGHFMNPMKTEEFKKVFESMCTYKTGRIEDMLTTEAWTALQDDSQAFADTFLKHAPKKQNQDTYDLDALLAEFYTMRHVETNDYTNQFFLAEYPGIKVNNYTYINDTIMACEINDKYLAIPYVDIAADYKVKMITIDKLNEIKIWTDEDMSELKIIDKNKEKIDNTLV